MNLMIAQTLLFSSPKSLLQEQSSRFSQPQRISFQDEMSHDEICRLQLSTPQWQNEVAALIWKCGGGIAIYFSTRVV